MIDLPSLLSNLGLGVASNAIYDGIKSYLTGSEAPTREGLEQVLENTITAKGLKIKASTVIDMLASSGAIEIRASQLFAPTQISYIAQGGARVFFGGNGSSTTSTTSIQSSGLSSGVAVNGNAAVRQNPDGSISFQTGPGGNVSFHVGD